MPTWGEILNELNATVPPEGGLPDFDRIRRKYLANLHQLTGRPTILYYSDWIENGGTPGSSMTLVDVQGFMEAVKNVKGENLDLLLHLPGGSAEVALRIVTYLRTMFAGEIRAFIPLAAMSAGTMLALACDRVVMGAHSQLGPIDPQIPQQSGELIRYVPARAIVQQFDKAREAIKNDNSALLTGSPILTQYGTSLLAECEAHEKLATTLVGDWLAKWMFGGDNTRAKSVANWFTDFDIHLSHSRGIDRDQARDQGIAVDNLEDSDELQDAVLSVHHATMHTLSFTPVKIIENHLGKSFIAHQRVAAPPTPVASMAEGQKT